MAKNELAKRLSKHRRESGVLTQKWTAQAFIDASIMVLCERGMTGKEALEVAKEILDMSFEVREGLTGRSDSDAIRTQVDRKLYELLEPEDMLPWADRYADWVEETLEEEVKRRRYRGK